MTKQEDEAWKLAQLAAAISAGGYSAAGSVPVGDSYLEGVAEESVKLARMIMKLCRASMPQLLTDAEHQVLIALEPGWQTLEAIRAEVSSTIIVERVLQDLGARDLVKDYDNSGRYSLTERGREMLREHALSRRV